MNKFLLFKQHAKQLILLSYPIILAQVGTVLMGITDTVMLGQVGKNEMAASGVANQLYFLFTSIGMGTLGVISSMVAASKSAKNNTECGEILRTGMELSFLLSLIICVCIFFVGENFHVFNQPPEVTVIVTKYLRILTISTIPLMLFISLKQYSDCLGYGKPAMLITVIALLINIVLNWIFIYGNLSFPAMGAYGAALATLFARILMALMLVAYIFKSKSYQTFLPPLISTFKTMPLIIKMVKIGLPGGLQFFFEIGAFAGAAVFVGWLGATELAAHQVALGLAALTYMVASGLSVGSAIRVANAFGENKKSLIMENAVTSIITVCIFMGIAALIFVTLDKELIQLFINDNSVIATGISILHIAALLQLFDGLQVVALGNLRGIEDVNKPTVITLLAYWVIALPLGYLLGFRYDFEMHGIWLGLLAGLAVSGILLTARFFILMSSGRTKQYTGTKLEKIGVDN